MVRTAAVLLLLAGPAVIIALACLERWTRVYAPALARRRIVAELGTERVTVDVPERPLLPALLRPAGTRVSVYATDVPVGAGSMLRSLSATLDGVRAEVRGRALTTGLGTFTATIDERELGALVRLPGVVSRLELSADGLRVWTVLGIAIDADVLVHDGALRVIPDPAQVAALLRLPGLGAFRRAIEGTGLRLELPTLPFDATVESLAFDVGQAVATGRLRPQRLALR